MISREDGLLECLRIGDFQSILSSRNKAFESILEPIVSVKQERDSKRSYMIKIWFSNMSQLPKFFTSQSLKMDDPQGCGSYS